MIRHMIFRIAGSIASVILVTVCSIHSSLAANLAPDHLIEINDKKGDSDRILLRRTAHGIVHVIAYDYEGIGYGVGYAYTQDNRCLLAHRIAEVNGRLAEQLGADVPVRSEVHDFSYTALQSDHYFRGWFDIDQIRAGFAASPAEVRELAKGYAAGVNAYLAKHQKANACPVRFKRNVTIEDVYRMWVATATVASGELVTGLLPHNAPPGQTVTELIKKAEQDKAGSSAQPANLWEPQYTLQTDLSSIGSNAWAIGRDATRRAKSIHLYNPHFPWAGIQRQYMIHVKIPGELDVMGVTLGGFPIPLSGFTKNIAWGLTFSPAARWSLADLQLEGDAFTYKVDGVTKHIDRKILSIPVLGEASPRKLPFFSAEEGPILDADAFFFGWWDDPNNPGRAYAAHDVNAANTRVVEQFLRIAQSKNVYELKHHLNEIQGVPFSYVVASDAQGEVFFGDISAVPNLSTADILSCVVSAVGAFHLPHGIVVLDGTRGDCQWSGRMPPEDQPSTIRSDYVANSNNTFEMPNTSERLTGFSPVLGTAGEPLSLRASLGLRMIADRLNGVDGFGKRGFTHRLTRKVFHRTRNLGGELLVDGIVADCKANPTGRYNGNSVDLTQVCTALQRWDRKNTIRSRGAAVFRGLWMALSDASVPHDSLFQTPPSLNQPLSSPAGYTEDLSIRTSVRDGLARVAVTFSEQEITPRARWGRVNKMITPDGEVAMPGGFASEGIFDSIVSRDAFYTFDGWSQTLQGNVSDHLYGASYHHVVSFGTKGPRASGLLAYGQATEPSSPWYLDQVKRWSKNRWFRFPFTEAQIAKDSKTKVMILNPD